MPKLSVIVTSYNIEPFIGACLDTVINQTLRDIEIIVVDDGSSDNSPNIIRSYAERDARIRPILFEKNTIGGVATAANAGLDAATGDYIGFADGDDLCELTMFERLYTAAVAKNADLALCKYLEFDNETGTRKEPAEARRWLDITQTSFFELTETSRPQFLKFIAVPWRKIYRRDLIEANKIRFPVGDFFFEDNPFHWFSVVSAASLVVVPEVLCYHRMARAGQTMGTADERLFRIFKHYPTISDWLTQRQVEPAYRTELIGWAASQLEWISRRTPDALKRSLFDIVAPLFGKYSRADIEKMLDVTGRGKTGRDLVLAAHANNFAGFTQALDGTPARNSLFREGLHHLRHSGVINTARATLHYTRGAMLRGLGRVAPGLAARMKARSDAVSNSDLLFALIVLQGHMERIEQRLATLEKRLPADEKPR